jgi:riboflavin kinase/FMN adenylyltransferase
METIRLHANDTFDPKGLVIALGFFDGMHSAHRTLLERAVAEAEAKAADAAVYTFTTHVVSHIARRPFRFLTSLQEKETYANSLGFAKFVVFEVDDELAGLEPEEFVRRFLDGCREVVIGFDFTFGRFGRGNAELLRHHGGFAVDVVDEIAYRGAKIGSSRIRDALGAGKVDLANRLLGHPYAVAGEVVRGKGRGKILGFPTANVDYDGYFLPHDGVYAARAEIGGRTYEAIANIGDNPTFSGTRVTLEVNILSFCGSLYGERIMVEFLAFIRKEIRYDSTAELVRQMHQDETAVRAFFTERKDHHE